MKKLYGVLAIVGITLLLIVFYRFNPLTNSFFPKCPFRVLTGWDCPGCGSQRAIHALLHGEIRKAVDYNALLVLSVPFLVVHYFFRFKGVLNRKSITWTLWYTTATPSVIFVLVILFWIVRNIPLAPFSYLAS